MQLDVFLQQARSTEWVVEGLVPANQKCSWLAPSGHGKSWFLESLGVAVTTG